MNTFTEALEALRRAISFRFFYHLSAHRELFADHKASLSYIWAEFFSVPLSGLQGKGDKIKINELEVNYSIVIRTLA